ncbi:Bug family tripartite tricarboxylate transporter substrate binding protein [Roseomonas sp. GCM10028921]
MKPSTTRRAAGALLAGAFAAHLPGLVRAQGSSSSTLRLFVTQPPGGGTDVIARLMAETMGRALGQTLVVDNRPGANGVLAVNALKQARPDGSAVLLGGVSLFSFNPNLYSKLPYDATRDFTYIAPVVDTALILVAGPKSGLTSLAQLVNRAKAEPDRLTYASVGIGNSTHLSMEMLTDTAGIRMTHVPFNGSGPSLTSVMTGETDCMVIPLVTALPQVQSGNLAALAMLTRERVAALPEVPTLKELGLEGLVMPGWYALVGPAGMSAPVIERINAAVQAALDDSTVAKALRDQYLEPMRGSAQFVRDSVAKDSADWGAFIRRRNLRVE